MPKLVENVTAPRQLQDAPSSDFREALRRVFRMRTFSEIRRSEAAGINTIANAKDGAEMFFDALLIQKPRPRFIAMKTAESLIDEALMNVGMMGNTTVVVKKNLMRGLTSMKGAITLELDKLEKYIIEHELQNAKGTLDQKVLNDIVRDVYSEGSEKYLRERIMSRRWESIKWGLVGSVEALVSATGFASSFVYTTYREFLLAAGGLAVPLAGERFRKSYSEFVKWRTDKLAITRRSARLKELVEKQEAESRPL